MEKIGIYGGTFSPPHLGHVHAAKVFLQQIKPDKLLIIPTCMPPHKIRNEATSAEDRLEMCHLAFSFSDAIEISDIEIVRQGKSYTVDTLRQLSRVDRELYFLCGTDMFLTMDLWREPQAIFSLCTVVCVQRERDEDVAARLRKKSMEYGERYGAKTIVLHADAYEASSTEIREDTEQGEIRAEKLSPEVAAYIRERGLYL